MWCIPKIDQEFVDRMEDVLQLYAKEEDPNEPVVCLDERPVQLHDAARPSVPMRPQRPARSDYEYVRQGTANIFCIVEPRAGRRQTHATANRKGPAFARALQKTARRYPTARTIHLVMDNLSTHTEKSLLTTFGETEGARLWRRFTVHYTPKHASWLDAAEMEASLVSRECLGNRRIGDLHTLQREIASWTKRADRERRRIDWTFRVDDARRVFRYDGITTPRSEH
jgi:DDE superfamily endonuclease